MLSGIAFGYIRHDGKTPSCSAEEVAFPYGFPSAGRYRIIVQMKHDETVETGIFDATVQ